MNVIENELILMVDVDDTLIIWGADPEGPKSVCIKNPHDSVTFNYVLPHNGHIKILKDRFHRGSKIIVWSAGGYAWAKAVVEALGLEKYVHTVMSKPIGYMDDKPADEILGERIYLGKTSTYGE